MSPSGPGDVRVVPVALGDRAYDVVIGAGQLATLGDRCADLFGRTRAFVVIDDELPSSTVDLALGALADAGLEVAEAPVSASEETKSLETAHELLRQLGSTGHERHEPVIALGGGVVGDVGGFVAATYKRGAPVVQCPTTLLSMVDASVGGKTGVNLVTTSGLKKNLVGSFWQPSLVLADVRTLASLSEREFRAGLAECVKHGQITANVEQPDLLGWIESRTATLKSGEDATLTELVERNVRVKSAVVASDERELDAEGRASRMILNLGHTFGHALESVRTLSPDGDPSHAPLLHGEAVALGLVAACGAGQSAGLLDESEARRVRGILESVGLPTRVGSLPQVETLIAIMGHDKKARGGRLRLVIPDGARSVRVIDGPPDHLIRAGFEAIRA